MEIEIKIKQVEKRHFLDKAGKTINYLLIGGMTKEGDFVEVSTSAAEQVPAFGANVKVNIRECKRVMLGVYKVRGSLV